MKHAPHLAVLCALLSVTACGGGDGAYPALLPTERILAEPVLPAHAADAAQGPAQADTTAAARAEALRRRADALRGPVIEPDALARMQAAGG